MNPTIDKAQGQWPKILESLGINSSYLKNNHGPCPNCGGKDRFRFDNKNGQGTFICNKCGAGNGIKLLQLYRGISYSEALKMVSEVLGETPYVSGPKHICSILSDISLVKQNPQHHLNMEKRRRYLNRIWSQTKPVVAGDPVDSYLKARGITLSYFPSVLRFHPELSYYDDENKLVSKFPAMLALVQNNENQCVTIHRTYLGDKCKADVSKPKKLMSPINPGASKGAAIKLFEPTSGRLALAEGIETAFCFNAATQFPVWATVSALGLKEVILPSNVIEVIIAIDNDKSGTGQEAANSLAKRLLAEGRRVKRVIPPKIGYDFADMLVEND